MPSPRTPGLPAAAKPPRPRQCAQGAAAPPAGGTRATSWAEAGTGGGRRGEGRGRFRGPERSSLAPLPLGAARLRAAGRLARPAPRPALGPSLLRPPAPGTSSRRSSEVTFRARSLTHENPPPSPAHLEISPAIPSFPQLPPLPCAPSNGGDARTPREAC